MSASRVVERLRELARRRFVRDVSVVAGGTVVANVIAIAFSPIITRLYGPEAFGVFGVFVAAVAMLAPAATLTYMQAVVLPESDGSARALVRLSMLVAGVVCLVALGFFALLHEQMGPLFGFEDSSVYLLLVPPAVVLTAGQQTLRQWLIRQGEFGAISRINVAQATALGGSMSIAGLVSPTAPVLLVLQTAGQGFYAALLWLRARLTLRPPAPDTADYSLRRVASTYRDFPSFRAPQVLLNSTAQNIPTLMLAAFFGPAAAGFYALGRRVLQLPSSLISQAVGTVFLPRIAHAVHKGEQLRPLVLRGTAALAGVGIVPFGLIIVLGPWLFGLVFGSEWTVAGEYARWLSFGVYFSFINVPAVQAIPLLDVQGHFLAYEVVATAMRAGALAAGALLLDSDVAAIALFATAGAVANVFLIGWVILRSGRPGRNDLVERRHEREPLPGPKTPGVEFRRS